MPHIVIECSANVRARTDLAALLRATHEAALETGVFPEGGTRTRIAEYSEYLIADADPANAFVHVVLRIARGRDAATKRRASGAIFAAVCGALGDASQKTPLAISLELEEMDPEYSYKKNNLHDYVKLRRTHA